MSDDSIYMLNVLWFKPDGGADRYKEYLKAAGPISAKHGGNKLDSYVPETAIIGQFDADLVFVVEKRFSAEITVFDGAPTRLAKRSGLSGPFS